MTVLRLMLARAALAVTLLAGPAAAAEADPFKLVALGPGVFAAIDGADRQSGSNAGFVIGDDGVLVVDSFFNPEASKALIKAVRARTSLPIRFVVNTHHHADHTAGDGVLKAAGALVIAHRNVRGWIHEENKRLLAGALTPARAALVDALTPPDVGLSGPATIWLGSRRIEIRPVVGHTGGDLVVEIPDARVTFCGDLFWNRTSPNTIDGLTAPWIETLKSFEAGAGPQAKFVPGHGDVGTAADVKDARLYLEAVRRAVSAARSAGQSDDALVAAVLTALKPAYGDWAAFAYLAPREARDVAAEMDGRKRTPVPVRD